jgi:CRISPR-associated protein Cmr4
MLAQIAFVHAHSPLHAGIGQGAGVIDLPIAREKATSIPFLPGASLKGALRTRCMQDSSLQRYKDIFGSDPEEMPHRASSVLFTDQKLLLLPVRSVAGTFAWVTSPYVLRRFVRELSEVDISEPAPPLPSIPAQSTTCYLTTEGAGTLVVNNNVYLEDFDLLHASDPGIDAWAKWLSKRLFQGSEEASWRKMFLERFCLVHDDLFHFMGQHATEITARIRLQDEIKVVTRGGLWYEEALPAETILSGIMVITPMKNGTFTDQEKIAAALKEITGKTLQFGGKATVGRGLCKVYLV